MMLPGIPVRQERVGRYRRISFIADLLASWPNRRL
jgi:hypothetical protein